MPSRLVLALAVACAGCVQTAVTRETLRPLPEHPAPTGKSPLLRGTEQAAVRLPGEEQVAIITRVVRVFYRPLMAQARWIDPRPLAHDRTRAADSVVIPDPDWAIAIAEAAGLRRVCPLHEANAQCQGRDGGVLRFSPPYVVGTAGTDSAIVYASYVPRGFGVASEIEFFLVRVDGAWEIVSRRNMPEVPEGPPPRSDIVDPRQSVEELLEADRNYARMAATADFVSAVSRMFVANVVMQAPGGHARGREAAIAALNADPEHRRSRVEWSPAGGGTASGGQDGFTYGYVTVIRPDGTRQPGKYVAYWVLRPGGWLLAAYKRVPRPAGGVGSTVQAPSLAMRALPRGDAEAVQRHADDLSLADHAFSRDAQTMGLGPAFAKWGAPDAVYTGGASDVDFVRGPDAIARSVSAAVGPNTTVEWAPTEVIVAATGDLGVSIGTIRVSSAGQTREVPYFTVWKRAWPSDPWRYVAE